MDRNIPLERREHYLSVTSDPDERAQLELEIQLLKRGSIVLEGVVIRMENSTSEGYFDVWENADEPGRSLVSSVLANLNEKTVRVYVEVLDEDDE